MTDLLSWEMQTLIWGYYVGGEDMGEFSAVVAENHPNTVLNTTRNGAPCWDRDRAYVDSIESWRDNERQPTWKFALAGLCDLRFYGIEKSA